jgi:hypothetical protein
MKCTYFTVTSPPSRKIGSIADLDPLNDCHGSLAGDYRNHGGYGDSSRSQQQMHRAAQNSMPPPQQHQQQARINQQQHHQPKQTGVSILQYPIHRLY